MAGIPSTMIAAGLLGAFDGRRKSKSEWEAHFASWIAPASNSEEQRVRATENAVRQAIASSNTLSDYSIQIVPQGSSINNTNTRNNSDLDLVLIAEAEVWVRTAPGEPFPSDFNSTGASLADEYSLFRRQVLKTLHASSGKLLADMSDANKAIKLRPLTKARVECDVVPTFRLRQIKPRARSTLLGGSEDRGVVFVSSDGSEVSSFPEQHLANGRHKNVRTANRYKHVVRILKKMRSLIDEGLLYAHPSSYEIECLVYNVPDWELKNGSHYDATVAAIQFLLDALSTGTKCNNLVQVHRVYSLFPHWGRGLLDIFMPEEVERCREFISAVAREIETQ
jgi:hypothetical protein